MKVDVIASLPPVLVLDVTDVVSTVRFVCATDEKGSVFLELHSAGQRAAVFRPADAMVRIGHIAAEMDGGTNVRMLFVIMGLEWRATQVLYE